MDATFVEPKTKWGTVHSEGHMGLSPTVILFLLGSFFFYNKQELLHDIWEGKMEV